MKLRPIISGNVQQHLYYSKPRRWESASINMQTSAGCIDKCAGPGTSAQCSATCALNDVVCWEQCAGSMAAKCVASCNKTALAQYQNL